MTKFRLIYTDFWRDPKVLEEMTPEDRLFYLYLLTNPCTTQVGIYQITKKQMAMELGYSLETINALMDRFINHHKLITYNASTREIAINNWGKYNLKNSGKPVLDCIKKELSNVKDLELVRLIMESVDNDKIIEIFQGFTDNSRNVPRSVPREGGKTKEEEEEENKRIKQKKETEEEGKVSSLSLKLADDFSKELEEITGKDYSTQIPQLKLWFDDYQKDWVVEAVMMTLSAGKGIAYAGGILKNWKSEGKNKPQNKPQGKKDNFNSFSLKHDYDFDNIEKKLLGWDKYYDENGAIKGAT